MIKHFGEDFHPEFGGWCSIEDEEKAGDGRKGIIISFITSRDPGKGNFTKFLKELKQEYDWVKVPTPFGLMREICGRHGFRTEREWFPAPYNEEGEVMVWRK